MTGDGSGSGSGARLGSPFSPRLGSQPGSQPGDERERLARAQAELVAALVARGPVPPSFDADRVAVQAAALADKRMRVAAHCLPDLAEALGERFGPLFRAYADEHPGTATGRRDAQAFARYIDRLGVTAEPAAPGIRARLTTALFRHRTRATR